jgi:hypothetical protein
MSESNSIFDKLTQDYNNILSDAFTEFKNSFPAIASPTLSKQETVTLLHSSIKDNLNGEIKIKIPWKSLFLFIPRVGIMFFKLCLFSIFFRVKSIPKDAIYFRTYLVPRCFKSTELIDDYFRELTSEVSKHKNVVVSFTSHNFKMMNRFRLINKKDNYIASDGLLTLLDIFRLFYEYLSTGLIKVKKDYYLDGSNIKDALNNSLLLDYLDIRSFEAYVEKYNCKKLVSFKINTFVYIYENQSWEKVCCSILKKNNIKLVAYQSSGFSTLFLNFFPTEKDKDQNPMPDIILTIGDYYRRYLIENGNYKVPIEAFCALRFSYLNDGKNYLVSHPNKKIFNTILYAFPVQVTKSNATLKDLISIFGDSNINVDLKFHPLYETYEIEGLSELPKNFSIIYDVDMSLLKDRYDCVLFNDNSFGIEALLKGVKSYQYNHNGKVTEDRFHYFDLWDINLSYDGLLDIHNQIATGVFNKSFEVDAVSDYMNLMFHPYNKSCVNKFLEIINN